MTSLPPLSFEASAHNARVVAPIKAQLKQHNGWLSFRDLMDHALYAPNLGYYAVGNQKFGMGGDFVTSPEISPIFAQTLANQLLQVLQATGGDILELGAGTGKFARDVLLSLAEKNSLPNQYFILEVSSHLRSVQQATLQQALPADLYEKIAWLNTLPQQLTGVVIGNEVLDALPVHLVKKQADGLFERGVKLDAEQLVWQDEKLATDHPLYKAADALHLPDGYLTEICLEATALINSLCDCLTAGAILMVDYGFDADTYYHPQRDEGTLMCHFQQYAHTNPLINIGLQDITAHVNFTQIAQAGFDQGLRVAGYTTQAQFLMNCGILQIMALYDPADAAKYAPVASGVQKLLSPTEMGELFKVIMLTKAFDAPCIGFMQGDKTHTL